MAVLIFSIVLIVFTGGFLTTSNFFSTSRAFAGYVMNKLAVMVLEGQKVTEGMDLAVPSWLYLDKVKVVVSD
jgi:hypothetical protein